MKAPATPAGAGRATLVKAVTVVDPGMPSPMVVDILVRNGLIETVERDLPLEPGCRIDEIVDGSSLLAMPGLVNAHYHSHDVLLKGSFDVMSLERWVMRALPRFYPPRSDRELRLRTLIGAAECLRGGITTVQDMLSLWPLSARQAAVVRDAYREAGIRVVLGIQLADTGPLDTMPFLRHILPPDLRGSVNGPPPPRDMPDPAAELDAILEAMPAGPDDLVTWGVCPSSPERCSRGLLERLRDAAGRHGLRLFSHIAISRVEAVGAQRLFAAHGGSPVRYLDSLGMLGPNLTLAHGVWLDDADRDLLCASGTRLVLNPMSNLKTRNGVARFAVYAGAGLKVGLGCDNCSCSDAQNMFQAMKLSVLLAGIASRADGTPTAADALRAATVGGAYALGLERSIGSIRPGFRADMTFLDRSDPVFRPLNDATRQIVYGEGGRGVAAVMVDGEFVVREGRTTRIDEEALDGELAELLPSFRRDAALVEERAAALDPFLARVEALSWEVDVGMERMLCR